jgi:hypothetical protein
VVVVVVVVVRLLSVVGAPSMGQDCLRHSRAFGGRGFACARSLFSTVVNLEHDEAGRQKPAIGDHCTTAWNEQTTNHNGAVTVPCRGERKRALDGSGCTQMRWETCGSAGGLL